MQTQLSEGVEALIFGNWHYIMVTILIMLILSAGDFLGMGIQNGADNNRQLQTQRPSVHGAK